MTELDKIARGLFLQWLPHAFPTDSYIDEDGDEQYFDDWVQGAWIGFRTALLAAPPGWELVPAGTVTYNMAEGPQAEFMRKGVSGG